MSRSPGVDAYIAKAAPFARPILRKLRALMHRACPGIEESLKWGVPHFGYQGMVANMAAFKKHASFGFWKQKLMDDPDGLFPPAGESSMGGKKVRSMSDLPPDAVLIRYIRAAVALNEKGKKLPPAARKKHPPLRIPPDLAAALKKNAKARASFEGFSPTHKREYVEWIAGAKQEQTRRRRLTQAVAWMAEGKPRNWKYMRR